MPDYTQTLIDIIPPLLVLDDSLRVKTANPSFYKHFLVSPAQTEDCLVYELGNGQWNIPELRAFLEEVLPQHKFFRDFQVVHEFEGIGRRTMLLSGSQVDNIAKIVLFIDDVTERVQSHAVQASEIRYRRLFEAARDGILLINPVTRKITDANPFMSELLDYTHAELLGKELWEIGLLKDEEASRAAFEQLQRNTFIRYENLPLQNKAGQHHEVEFVSNSYDEAGERVIQCNIRDITERKKVESELIKAKDQLAREAADLDRIVTERTAELRETVGELEAFSFSVAHDMRAPLRAMQGFAQYLIDDHAGKLDEQGVDYLTRIMRSASRLDRLIQDILSYTGMIHGRPVMETVNLDRLVHDIVDAVPNGLPIKPEILIKGTLPRVVGNEALLAQCVSNLISNGVKFVAPGSTPRLEISAESFEDASIRVLFKDDGIGIAPENHARVFRLFERIHPAPTYEGTGIGLSIVRKAVERMGGQVSFESVPGNGSTFWLQLKKAE